MENAHYFFASKGNKYFIKLEGSLRYSNCQSFDYFIDLLFKKYDVSHILIDLNDVEFMDSTNLGLLAKIYEYYHKIHDKEKIKLLSLNKDINEILESMGLDRIFTILKDKSVKMENLTEINQNSEKTLAQIMIEAHKELMSLNPDNEAAFKEVVLLMEKEINKDA